VLQENVGYTIGITSVLNSHTFLVSNGLIQIAQPVLQELAKSTGFASSISVRVEMKQIQLSRVEGNVPLPYQLPVGELMPLHLGGARILAAALEPEVLDILLQSIREIRLATGEIVTHADFVESLKEIRDQGYVHGFSQRELGAASVAVPVIGREGKVIASLQLSWVSGDVGHGKIDWHVAELKRASAAISRRLP
jgi:IclR family acetate operon transcriptional repressor